MSDNNLKEVWLFAMDQLKNEYKLQGEEKEFTLWFNMNYIEDNIDTIKVSVPNQFMWNSMKSKGNVDKVIEKMANNVANAEVGSGEATGKEGK